ncbi:MAG: hypothetical protein II871_04860 [Clostridia bacterium]|nr:hypothetical protein [Clostridia bacterium]
MRNQTEQQKITLREVNTRNFNALLKLEVNEEQERFVADNEFSLAEAYVVNASGRYAKL